MNHSSGRGRHVEVFRVWFKHLLNLLDAGGEKPFSLECLHLVMVDQSDVISSKMALID
jgi:hypothetical protein